MKFLHSIWLLLFLVLTTETLRGQYLGGEGDGHSSNGGMVQLGCTIPPEERAALEQIYASLNGDDWNDNSNWLVTADESLWYGVQIENCHVVALFLSDNNLDGAIPPELVNFFQLRELWLDNNKITGGLDYVPILEALEIFHFEYNGYSSTIPSSFGGMTGLQELYLSDNKFEGDIPPEMGNMFSLRILNLSENKLTGTIPVEFGFLHQLEEINVADNKLTAIIPNGIENLVDYTLHFADFSRNEFTDMIALGDGIDSWDISYNRLDFGDMLDIAEQVDLATCFYAPQKELQPGGAISFTVGGTLTIPFATPGSGNHYQWYRGNTPVGTDNPILTINNATLLDVGIYRLAVTNPAAPDLELWTEPFIVSADGCDGITRTSGNIDLTFDAEIENPDGDFVFMQGNDILTSFHSNNVGSTAVDGVYRFHQDGTLDPAFSIPGISPLREAFIVLPDNSLLVGESNGTYAYVRKRTSLGAIDPGLNSINHQWYAGHIYSMARQSTGDILVSHDIFGSYPYVDRIKPDGDPDPSFNQLPDFEAHVMRVRPDDKIVAGGFNVYGVALDLQPAIYLLDSDGQVNNSFAAYMSDLEGEIFDIAIQPDGKIIVVGRFRSFNDEDALCIVRLTPNGTTDNNFMNNTPGITEDFSLGHYISNVELQADGKILISGVFSSINGSPRWGVARLNSNGTLDCAFDPLDGPMGLYEVAGIAIQPDKKILLSGYFYDWESVERNGLVRIEGDPSSDLIINDQPESATVCVNGTATFSTLASVAPVIYYEWQFSPDGVAPFTVVPGEAQETLTISSATEANEGYYRCQIGADEEDNVYTVVVTLTVDTITPPAAVDVTRCGNGSATLTATGGVAGDYRWYTASTGAASLIPGETNAAYATPALSTTTTYYVALNQGSCESARTDVDATIAVPPSPPTVTGGSTCGPGAVTLNASGAAPGAYRWYTALTGGTAIAGEVNATYTTPSISATTFYYVTIYNGTCESDPRMAVSATVSVAGTPPTASGASRCGPGTIPLTASGGVDGQYRWYTVPSGGTPIAGEVNSMFTTPSILTTTNYYVSINPGCETLRTSVVATVLSPPPSPVGSGASRCGSGSVTLSATGSVDGNYRWYTIASGGTAIAGEVNATFNTPSITATTSYFVSINDGTCEGARAEVIATVLPVPAAPVATGGIGIAPASVILLAGGGLPGQYRWYTTSTGGTAIAGETNAMYVTPVLSTSTAYYVAINNGSCESPRTLVVADLRANQAPIIQPPAIETIIQGSVTVRLTNYILDPDNNLELSTLEIKVPPKSGAHASIDAQYNLVLDYSGLDFSGTDVLTIRVCDSFLACTDQEIEVEVAGDIVVFNAISPNGDDKNPSLFIQYITAFPQTKENKVMIFNRWGTPVFEITNYDNVNRVFTGVGNNGELLPSGTYYYKIDFVSGSPSKTGYLQINH